MTPRDFLNVGAFAVVVGGLAFLAGSDCHGRNDLDAHLRTDDSTHAAELARFRTENARANHERAASLAEKARGDSLERVTVTLRHSTRSAGTAYDSARALVVIDSLPPRVQDALLAADRFRVAVTASLAADSATIQSRDLDIADLEAVIVDKDLAIGHLLHADSTSRAEVADLKHQRAPRCSTKCGAILGAAGLAAFTHGTAIVDAAKSLLSLVRHP